MFITEVYGELLVCNTKCKKGNAEFFVLHCSRLYTYVSGKLCVTILGTNTAASTEMVSVWTEV